MTLANPPLADAAETLKGSLPGALKSLQATCRPETVARGKTYEEEGRVRILSVKPDWVRAEVIGTDDAPYEVALQLGREPPTSSCTCPSWGSWDDHCKHVVALAFALDKMARGDRSSALLARALSPPEPPPAEAPAPSDFEELREWLGLPSAAHAFQYHLALAGSGLDLGIERSEGAHRARGRFLLAAPYLAGRMLEPADCRVFAAVQALPRDPHGSYRLTGAAAGAALELLRSRAVFLAGAHVSFAPEPAHLFAEVAITDARRQVAVRLRLGDGTLVALSAARFLSDAPTFALHGAILHRLETGAALDQLERFRAQPTFSLPREAGPALEVALGGLRRLGVILDAGAEVTPPPAAFALTLDGDAEAVKALLAVRYGDLELPLTHAGAATHVTTDGRLLKRDVPAEEAAVEALLASGLVHGGGAFVARGDRAVDFWTRGVQGLPEGIQISAPSRLRWSACEASRRARRSPRRAPAGSRWSSPSPRTTSPST